MKILFLAQYITLEGNPAFMRNITGYGYMVKDIAEAVGVVEQVDLLTLSGFTKETHCGHIHLLRKTRIGTFLHLKMRYMLQWWHVINQYSFSFKRELQLLVYYASLGYIDHILKTGNYDLVHIHGVGGVTRGYEKVCKRYRIPYLITLHGLNSFEEGILMEAGEKRVERDFLRDALVLKKLVSFISTGIKSTAEQYLKIKECVNFLVIPNGTVVCKQNCNRNIREIYGINNSDFLLVYVGNISLRKNQIQVAQSYLSLPEQQRKRVKILFVGQKNENGLADFIADNHLSEHLICIGNIPKTDIHNFYIAADATIMSSISEGFGLSIIEGFVYGKPNVTFADLAAVPDLYHEKAMVLVKERSDIALANGMLKVMNNNWDAAWITRYAENFSFEVMAKRYLRVYQKILNREY
ncbi:glycosyltransferase family 4 protein [Parabacteroides pacaensis]|uniref:glycosyltransferase family 4 protein n=1 Tax=Parabacteroides pacaensis TaxID=2086575 RepID=UPI000D101EE9|nr:glycosyltransferase family 4 protein [Parabacteroides pacaensis]